MDFVLPWVDGADPAWQEEFARYRKLYTVPALLPEYADNAAAPASGDDTVDASAERYRDWGTLRYWFRGVEKFAPWVNRIHFITWGHLPPWLDTSHPKLNVVRHSDFIPAEYLPTFSSIPIELNMHRIEGLSERFVYFNDDMFLCRSVSPERFFKGGLPRDTARLGVVPAERIGHNILECVRITARRHPKSDMRRHLGKWFNLDYTLSDMLKTLTLLPWNSFTGFKDTHMPQPFLKSTFLTLWNEEEAELDATCRHRLRTATDPSQWLMRYEQLASGQFEPIGMRDVKLAKLSDDNMEQVGDILLSGRYSMVCINDNNEIEDPQAVRESLIRSFDALLPEKSSYEL